MFKNISMLMLIPIILISCLLILCSTDQQAYAAADSYQEKLVKQAESEWKEAQKNNLFTGGERYWRADGATTREDWCADFVSYCAEKAGLMKSGWYPKRGGRTGNTETYITCNCAQILEWLTNTKGKCQIYYNNGSYVPKRGDLCFRSDNKTYVGGSAAVYLTWDHIGVVSNTGNSKGKFKVIEGNKSNKMANDSYDIGDNHYWTCFLRFKESKQTGLDISRAVVSGIQNKYYNAKAQKQKLKLTIGGKQLSSGFKISYLNNIDVGEATVKLTGSGLNYGSKSVKFSILAPSRIYMLKKDVNVKYKFGGKSYKGKNSVAKFTTSEQVRDNLLKQGYVLSANCGFQNSGEKVYEFENKYSKENIYVRASSKSQYSLLNGSSGKKCGWKNNGVKFYSNTRHNKWYSNQYFDGVQPYNYVGMDLGTYKPTKSSFVGFYCC